MSDIKDWKDTAASNNASPPDGWPEGQAPSTVNNCAREMMRAIRVRWEDAAWFDWGLTYSLKSQNKLRISDQSVGSSYAATDVYSVGQRVKIVSNNATIYGSVTTLSSSSTAVIIDVNCDSGTLTSTITSVAASILQPGANPVSGYNAIDQNSSQIYGDDGGAADAYTLTLDPAITAYEAGQVFHFKATNANTGASTLNVDGLGVKTIKKRNDQDVASGDIEAGQIVSVVYDGTNFQMLSQLASGGGGGGGGKILQVVQGTLTSSATITSATLTDTGLTASITPSSTSSKILVMVSMSWTSANTNQLGVVASLLRDTTEIFVGDAAGSRTRATAGLPPSNSAVATSGQAVFAVNYLDSPSTISSTTYKIQVADKLSPTSTIAINRSSLDTNTAGYTRSVSSIILLEVDGT